MADEDLMCQNQGNVATVVLEKMWCFKVYGKESEN